MRVSAIEAFQRFSMEQQRIAMNTSRHRLDQQCWAEHQRLAEAEQARIMRGRSLGTGLGENIDIYA